MRYFFALVYVGAICLLFVRPLLAQPLEERGIYSSPWESGGQDRQCWVESQAEASLLEQVFWYLPNRVLDLFDMVRLRARVGPGFGVGVRATKVVQVHLGSHAAIYGGLPGPRGRRMPKSPIGLECHSGIALSMLELSTGLGFEPGYTMTEVGADLHLGLVGAAVGVDPVEIADFFAGFFLVDIRDDDFGKGQNGYEMVNCSELEDWNRMEGDQQ